ncbi:uncharacterized protein LTR77_008096 [Saxophila tyrrhenica]|uniref:Uncharacterized protein n=1 Tax=Saxophila tyrrhenica TaxID=1690608 RepID=A0AAV9P4T4_9PEZI|nr:hypothetical protein LTR77_008096 [Saxophila tyrrhenica]
MKTPETFKRQPQSGQATHAVVWMDVDLAGAPSGFIDSAPTWLTDAGERFSFHPQGKGWMEGLGKGGVSGAEHDRPSSIHRDQSGPLAIETKPSSPGDEAKSGAPETKTKTGPPSGDRTEPAPTNQAKPTASEAKPKPPLPSVNETTTKPGPSKEGAVPPSGSAAPTAPKSKPAPATQPKSKPAPAPPTAKSTPAPQSTPKSAPPSGRTKSSPSTNTAKPGFNKPDDRDTVSDDRDQSAPRPSPTNSRTDEQQH